MNQAGRFPAGPQRKTFSYPNPPGFFPFIMKGYEFYHPPLNHMVMRHTRDDRIKSTINQLYSASTYRCTKCGMRFQHHSELKEHLDYHFQQSATATERRMGPMTRKPFSSYMNWISDSGMDIITKNDETMTREQQELENCVPFSTNDGNCFICGEEFKTVLKDDDEWYFINCKKAKLNNETIKVHVSNCAKIIEDLDAKFKEAQAKESHEEDINTSQSSARK